MTDMDFADEIELTLNEFNQALYTSTKLNEQGLDEEN